MKRFSFYILLSFFCFKSLGQTIPLGTPIIEEYFRNQQLLGQFDSSFTFNYRPIVLGENGVEVDSSIFNPHDYFGEKLYFLKKKGHLRLLPAELRVAYDHKRPDSRNDGAMIRSRGFQTLASAGVYAELGILSIQFKPEFILAENKDYQGFPMKPRHFESSWESRYVWFNRMDEPERYGTEVYSKMLLGQSSISLNKWGISLGLSTENIWWGPAIRNSIMMSNNAQGFPHITLNTQRAIKTSIGNFEGQFVTGKLEASGYDPPATDVLFRGKTLFVPKKDDWRYFQAITASYSPKWIKGLSLGFTRWVQQYSEITKETNNYFPVFENLFRQNDPDEGLEGLQDQAAGLFGRWVWYDSKAEFYFEFAKNDAAVNLRDLLVDTDHARALTVGINKLFDTKKAGAYYRFNFEWTQMSQTESRFARQALSWYIHHIVRHGYTHNGEVLGSGLGPGGNAQYFEVAWIKGLKKIGGSIERYVHNNDFFTFAFGDTSDFGRYWVDYNITGYINWEFDKLLFSSSIMYTRALNYQWELAYDPNATPFNYFPDISVNNFNVDLKLAYRF